MFEKFITYFSKKGFASEKEKIEQLEVELSKANASIAALKKDIQDVRFPQRQRPEKHSEILHNKGSAAPNAIIFDNVVLEHPVNIMHQVTLYNNSKIGRWSYINVGTIVYRNVEIGRYCSIARDCEIGLGSKETSALTTHDFIYHDGLFPRHSEYCSFPKIPRNEEKHQKIIIGNDVWIGAKTIVMGGGDNREWVCYWCGLYCD